MLPLQPQFFPLFWQNKLAWVVRDILQCDRTIKTKNGKPSEVRLFEFHWPANQIQADLNATAHDTLGHGLIALSKLIQQVHGQRKHD